MLTFKFVILGEDLKELFGSVAAPQLFMPAGGDAPEDMANGLAKEVSNNIFVFLKFIPIAQNIFHKNFFVNE